MEVVGDTLVYVGGYVFLVFMAVCLATGACETRRRDARARKRSFGGMGAMIGEGRGERCARWRRARD